MKAHSLWLGLEDPENAELAYQWHRGTASENWHLLPSDVSDFAILAEAGQVIAAKDKRKDYIGLAYFEYSDSLWIINELVVAQSYRGRGIPLILTCLALAHLLLLEDPLARDERVVAYAATTDTGSGYLSDLLQLRSTGRSKTRRILLEIGESEIVSSEYEMTVPGTILALADWFRLWNGQLSDNTPVELDFGLGMTASAYCRLLRSMAER